MDHKLKLIRIHIKEPKLMEKIYARAKRENFETNLPFYVKICLCKFFKLPERVICYNKFSKRTETGRKNIILYNEARKRLKEK